MTKLLIALLLAPTFSFAAPWGHQICRGQIEGKTIRFIYGVEAVTGEAKIRIDGKTYNFDATWDTSKRGTWEVFSATSSAGSIRWLTRTEFAKHIVLSVDIADTKFENKVFHCHVLDSVMGNEQN